MMMVVFYQTKPKQDTPYRRLSLACDSEKGWVVQQAGGEKWGRENSQVLGEDLVKDWHEGMAIFNRLFNELVAAGWRPYTPYETWEPEPTFQKSVKR